MENQKVVPNTSNERILSEAEAEKEQINSRVAELYHEAKSLTEYNSTTKEDELEQGIDNIWKNFISKEQADALGIIGFDGESFNVKEDSTTTYDNVRELAKEINEDVESRVDSIETKAYKGIDYVDYINEVSVFMKQQMELQQQDKKGLKFVKQNNIDKESKLAGGYNNFHRKVMITDHPLGNPFISSVKKLYILALYGANTSNAALQHETIHHYQRVKEKSPILRFWKLYKLNHIKTSHVLGEIHARLHDSMLGMEKRSEEDILSDLVKGYNLPEEQRPFADNAIKAIKKFYALDVSNRRIATLVRENKNLEDISRLEEEINKVMNEKDINNDTLAELVEIDDLQRLVVHLRTKKLARQEIAKLNEKSKMNSLEDSLAG